MNNIKTILTQIEKEFDDNFSFFGGIEGYPYLTPPVITEALLREIKSFIKESNLRVIEHIGEIALCMKIGQTIVLGTKNNPSKINKTISRHKTEAYNKAMRDLAKVLIEEIKLIKNQYQNEGETNKL